MDIYRGYIKYLKPDKDYNDKLLLKLFEWTPSYKITEWKDLTFDGKEYFDAYFIMVPFLPEMKDISLKKVIEKIDDALSISVQCGCKVAALGAFTSIVLQGKEEDYAKKHEIKITSGNALTAAGIIRSVEKCARDFGVDLSDSTIGIIGASGDIGSSCATYFGNKVKKMILTAKSKNSLEIFYENKKDFLQCEIELSTNNAFAVKNSNIIIFVTSSYVPMFNQDDFLGGTIVCDASAPQNVYTKMPLRKDVFIYHGGILSLPFKLDPGFDIGLASPYSFYGCQIEGILLLLDDSLPFSWGRGNISIDKLELYLKKIETISNLGICFSIGKHEYTNEEINKYKENIYKNVRLISIKN